MSASSTAEAPSFESLRLYTYWRSGSAWRVRIALNIKGISYTPVVVNIAPSVSEQHTPAWREKNPMGQVPLLEFVGGSLDGRQLAQSIAVIELLDDLVAVPALLPIDPWAKAQARMMAEIVNSGTQPLQNLSVQKALKDAGTDVDAWLVRVIGTGLSALEAAASKSAGEFLVGDDVSVADVCLVPQLYAARRFNVPLDAYTTLLAVEARCAALPAFAAAHPDRQPDAPAPAAPAAP
jgi:maleylpyruvate isomerase